MLYHLSYGTKVGGKCSKLLPALVHFMCRESEKMEEGVMGKVGVSEGRIILYTLKYESRRFDEMNKNIDEYGFYLGFDNTEFVNGAYNPPFAD